ncbi:hypothetical protein OH77DRAFT_1509388, partial [Trametes cingulata]
MAPPYQHEQLQSLATICIVLLLVHCLPIPTSSTAEATFTCADLLAWAYTPSLCIPAVSRFRSWYLDITPSATRSTLWKRPVLGLWEARPWLLAVALSTCLWPVRYAVRHGLVYVITGVPLALWHYRNALRVILRETIDLEFIAMCSAFELAGLILGPIATLILPGLEPVDSWVLVPCAIYVPEPLSMLLKGLATRFWRCVKSFFATCLRAERRQQQPETNDYISWLPPTSEVLTSSTRELLSRELPGLFVSLARTIAILPASLEILAVSFVWLGKACVGAASAIVTSYNALLYWTARK